MPVTRSQAAESASLPRRSASVLEAHDPYAVDEDDAFEDASSAPPTTEPRARVSSAVARLPIERMDGFKCPDVRRWLRRFRTLCIAVGAHPGQALPLYVAPEVLDLLLDAHADFGDFEVVSALLQRTYGVKKDVLALRRRLQTRRQGRNETAAEFAAAISRLCADVGDNVDNYVGLFLAGLHEPIAALMGLQEFESFVAAVAQARVAEARVDARRGHARVEEGIATVEADRATRAPSSDRRQRNNPIVCFYCRNPGHRIRDCRKRMEADKRRQKTEPGSTAAAVDVFEREAATVTADTFPSVTTHAVVGSLGDVVTGNRPAPFVVEGLLNGTETTMLVDTGALVSLVSADFAAQAKIGPLAPSSVILRGADKQRINAKGRATGVCLSIGTSTTHHDFIVAEHLAHPVILGVELLATLGAVIDVQRRRLVLANGSTCDGANATTRHVGPMVCAVEHGPEGDKPPNRPAELTHAQQQQVEQLLRKHEAAFASDANKGVPADLPPMRIDTGDHPPMSRPPYRRSATERTVIEQAVQQYLKDGVVKPSFSPWASPVVLVKKKSGEWRFCVDYRKLNSVTVPDAFPMPRLDDTLDNMGGARYFTTLDLASAYHQCPLADDACAKTAFITHQGLFEFTVVPFGLRNAPAYFQRSMQAALADVPKACIYLDDIVLFSSTFEEHMQTLNHVLARLRDVGLRLKRSKCRFLQQRTEYLGHIVSSEGVRPDPAKVESIANMQPPTGLEGLRRFLGMVGFYRRFVNDFAGMAAPLYKLLKKDAPFDFGAEQSVAFNRLRTALCTAPVLAYPDFARPFRITTDASGTGLGAVLSQTTSDGTHHPVAFISRSLNNAEKNYSVSEQECLGVVWAIRKFRAYVFATRFEVVTDHAALRWLRSIRDPRGRLGRWSLELQDCDFEVVHRPGTSNVVADALSRLPRSGVDATVAAIGQGTPDDAAVADEDDGDDDGQDDPLLAEPEQPPVVQRAVPWLTGDGLKTAQHGDPLCKAVRSAWAGEESIDLDHVGLKPKQFWSSLHHFRETGDLVLFDNQVVLPASLVNQALHQAHDHPAAGHLGIERTYRRMAAQFYLPGLYAQTKSYVTRCLPCQQVKAKPPQQLPMGRVTASRPMELVAMDFLGPLPTTNRGNKHLLVVSDVFTKFVVAIPLHDQKATTVVDALSTHFFSVLGIPEKLLSDQGPSFRAKDTAALFHLLRVRKVWTSPYHPQTDGMVERWNRTVCKMLGTLINARQTDWDKFVGLVTLAYNTSFHSTVGNTPYFLRFGVEPPTSISGILDSLPQDVSGHMVDMIDALREAHAHAKELLEDVTQSREVLNQLKADKFKEFSVGDVVLLHVPRAAPGTKQKLAKLWHGPFRISKKHSTVNYTVTPMTGGPGKVVHASRLKVFHGDAEQVPEPPADILLGD